MTPSLPEAVRDAVADLAAWVRSRFGDRVYRLALFGSFARGDGALPDSDVDVLVAIDGMTSQEMFAIADRAAAIGSERTLVLTPLPVTGDEWRKYERQDRLIAREVARDAVPL